MKNDPISKLETLVRRANGYNHLLEESKVPKHDPWNERISVSLVAKDEEKQEVERE